MFCSSDHQCVFIHVPKTGGASINRTFKDLVKPDEVFGPKKIDMGLDPRRFAWEVKNQWATPTQWNSYFKFAYVRNPWDMVVSIYHNIVQSEWPENLGGVKEDKRIVKKILVEHFGNKGEQLTFHRFVEHCVFEDALNSRFSYHWRPQYLHVTDPSGKIILDFIGRFESFGEDWEKIQTVIGTSIQLPHFNRSSHLDYRQYYTKHLRDAVARRFEQDIDLFGYTF